MARGAVQVVAFDQKNRQALATGKLLLVDNAIDQATATIRLKAIFPNDDEQLWPGDFVNARLLLETRANAIVVPASAVQRGPQGLFAWIVTERQHRRTTADRGRPNHRRCHGRHQRLERGRAGRH